MPVVLFGHLSFIERPLEVGRLVIYVKHFDHHSSKGFLLTQLRAHNKLVLKGMAGLEKMIASSLKKNKWAKQYDFDLMKKGL